jgi:hypothetical protein
MSVTTVPSPTVVIPTQFYAPSVPSTQAVALALIAAPVAASQVTHAGVAMPADQVAPGSASAHAAGVNLMAGTGPVESPAPQHPALGRHVDMYL